MKTELFHATRSGAVESIRQGIDARRSQGFGQGAGFFLWKTKQLALEHGRDMESAEYSKEVSVTGHPVIVTVREELTPEDFDVDYEAAGPDFLKFLERNKDWITQRSAEIMTKVNFDGLGISIWGESMPRRSMRFDSTELSVSQAQSLGRLAERISALEPEVMRRFETLMLDRVEAVKYVGSRLLYPSRIETLDGTLVNPYKAAIPIVSGIAYIPNPIDLAGRHIPERYLAGLPPELQQQRIRELTQSRDAYKKGDYSELPTDRAARKMGLVKQSKYTTEAKKRGIEYRGDLHDMASRVLRYYGARATSSEVSAFAGALKKSFSKGLAAWKSGGHRPGATAQNWAVARVNSLVVGGKTSWTADKKQFEVLPEAVQAKIESMRSKQNPIRVEVEGGPSGKEASGRHTRFYQSRAALDRIEEQGREVVPDIKFRIEWGYKLFEPMRQKGRIRFERGERGVVTLVADATKTQSLSDAADQMGRGRPGKVSLYTAHTILHRLGDNIMPVIANLTLMDLRYEPAISRGVTAGLVVTERVERAWRKLSRALYLAWDHFGYSESSLDKWFPTVVDTKACREGWITDSLQAMAETVPYRLLYKKGRENGVRLLSDLPFVPELEAALTEYIDASMDMLKGYQVEI